MSKLTNCTINSATSIEATGDKGADGNMVTSVQLTITPDDGYTLSMADFTISGGTASSGTTFTHGVGGVSLPTGITSVTFSQSGIPYTPGNVVYATCALTASYAMPGSDTTLTIDVRGIACAGVKEYYGYNVSVDTENNLNATVSASASGTNGYGVANTLSTATSGTTRTDTFAGSAFYDPLKRASDSAETTKIGQVTITAAGGYHFYNMPSLAAISKRKGPNYDTVVFLRPSSQTVDSQTGLTSAVIFDVMYYNNTTVEAADRIATKINIQTRANYSTALKVHGFAVGNNQDVSSGGETRAVCVTGNPGAKFNLQGVDSTGKELFTQLIDAEIPAPTGRDVVNAAGVFGEYKFNLELPELPSGTTEKTYYFRLKTGTNTTFASTVPTTEDTVQLIQIHDPRVRFTNTKTPAYSVTAAPTLTYFGKRNRSFDEVYSSRPTQYKRYVDVDWTLTGGGTFTVLKQVVLSDFTNTSSATNGGTTVATSGLKVSGHGTSTVTIKGKIHIRTFGKSNVDLNLNLDNIVSYS